MTLAQRLELRQSQSLALTPRLQQSIRMLRMSSLELAEYVASVVEANPLLEAVQPPRLPVAADAGAMGLDAVELAPAPLSLREHLRLQVRAERAAPAVTAAALAIIDELDDDGYLRVPLAEVAARAGVAPAAAEAGLALVQGAEPAGVGARDLAECLGLQLRERGLLDARMACLLAHLSVLATGGRAALAARCGLAPHELDPLLATLRRLDPRPGAGFAVAPVSVVIPDVFVRRDGGLWRVELNDAALPRVLVNRRLAARVDPRDRHARAFLMECQLEARWLVRSLAQRARTLLRVAEAVVRHQERFFAIGRPGLQPLSRRALADLLGLHESTVGRIAVAKHLACDQGTFPLHFFFSRPVPGAGGRPLAATTVQDRIRALIRDEEVARALSDDRIVRILRREGIDIARRTVAKYREGMGIPSSVERRRLAAVPHGGSAGLAERREPDRPRRLPEARLTGAAGIL